jgi:hypothetical protein
VHARSVVVTAHELMDRGAFTAEELRARMPCQEAVQPGVTTDTSTCQLDPDAALAG